MEARASRSLRTVTAEIENRLTMSATVTWPSWSTRSSTLRRRCSVSRRGLGVMHRFRMGEYRASLQLGSNDESIARTNTFVFFLFVSFTLCLLLRLLFYCGKSFLLDYFVGEVRLEVQSHVCLCYWLGTSILCVCSTGERSRYDGSASHQHRRSDYRPDIE